MRKILVILSLSGLLSILLVPITASVVQAAPCASSCNAPVSVNCTCEGFGLTAGVHYCSNGKYFSDRTTCLAGTTGTTVGDAPEAPTVVRDVNQLVDLINKIGNWVFVALMAVAGTFLIIAGLMWVTAGGSPEKITKARQMLVNALIGVAIGLLARGIVMVIRSIIG